MKILRGHRPSPAMLVALLALFIATSGTAYAAGLVANSVGRIHMKDNAIASPEVVNGSLKAADIAAAERVKIRAIGPWHNVGEEGQAQFGATWSNHNELTYLTRYRLEGDIVRLDGQAESSEGGFWSSKTNRIVFTLPAGFRPTHDVVISVAGQQTMSPGFLYITTAGGVYVLGADQSGWVNFPGVTFTTS